MYLNDAFWSIIPGNEAKAYAALGALAIIAPQNLSASSIQMAWAFLLINPIENASQSITCIASTLRRSSISSFQRIF